MRYDKYLKRIQTLNKVVNGIYRLRFVLISAASLALVSVMTFEFTKGIVKIESFEKLTYTYGELVSATSSAFANDAEVEYKEESATEWVKEAPIYPGNYEVRGVSTNGFGAKTTSKSIKFSILPKPVEISISNSQITYGDLPSASASLFGTDAIASYSVKYEDEFSFSTKVEIDKDTVVINDKNGNDITRCYDISTKEKEITVLPRPISVTFKNFEKVYDSKDIEEANGEITNGTLAGGDNIEFIENETHYSDPGSYQYSKDFVIKRGDVDVTKMYSVSTIKGNLKIAKVAINAYSDSYDNVYNGKTLLENDALNINVENEKLVEGHKAVVEFDEDVLNMKDFKGIVSNLKATFSIKILDAEDNDVTYTYDISTAYGTINVGARDLEITFGSGEKLYDGIALSNKVYACSEDLVSTDTVQINEDLFPSIVTPQSVMNFVESSDIHILDEDLNDITNYYNVSLVPGELIINKPKLYFDMPSFGDIVYDGQTHVLDNFELNSDYSDEISSSFSFKLTGDIRSYKDVGVYDDNELGEFEKNKVDVYLGDDIVTDCFDIEYQYYSSSIAPRSINPTFFIIKGENEVNEITYDSFTHDVGVKFGEDEIVSEVDKPVINCEPLFNAGEYTLEDFEFDIIDIETGFSTYGNYQIEDFNTITINKKEVEVKLPNAVVEYKGDYYDFKLNEEELDVSICENDTYYAESLHEINVGEYEFTSDMFTCTNYDNYIFKFTPSESTVNKITKRPISINFSDFETTYNGENQYVPFSIDGDLVEGHSVVGAPSNALKVRNAKEYHKSDFSSFFGNDGELKLRIVDANNVDVTDNYEITENFDDVSVKVNPIKIGVKFSINGTYSYIGEKYTFDDYSIMDPEFKASKDLASGETAEVIDAFSAKRAGEYINDNKALIQINGFDEEGNMVDTTGNYEITYSRWDKVKIGKAKLDITIDGFNDEYDGFVFKDHFESHKDLISCKVDGVDQALYEGTKVQISYKTDDTILFITNRSLQNYINVTLVNDSIEKPENDYYTNTATGLFDINSITYGTVDYSKRALEFKGKKSNSTYSNETPNNLGIEYAGDTDGFYNRHQLLMEQGALSSDGIDYGTHNLLVDQSKFHLSTIINDQGYDVTEYVDFVFSNLSKQVVIKRRSLTIKELGDEFFEGEKEKATEQFTISGLLKNDSLYLVNDNGVEEEVNSTKTDYSLIIDMKTAITVGTAFKYQDGSGNSAIIMSDQFRIKTYRDGKLKDVTNNYKINLTKDSVRFGNPIYIKKGETAWKSTDVQNVKPSSKES